MTQLPSRMCEPKQSKKHTTESKHITQHMVNRMDVYEFTPVEDNSSMFWGLSLMFHVQWSKKYNIFCLDIILNISLCICIPLPVLSYPFSDVLLLPCLQELTTVSQVLNFFWHFFKSLMFSALPFFNLHFLEFLVAIVCPWSAQVNPSVTLCSLLFLNQFIGACISTSFQ